MYYRNAEGYPDPTAGEAMARIALEEKRKDKAKHRMTQKEFYKSRAWRRARLAYIDNRIAIDGGLCEQCHNELGVIVHHKIWLNDTNCNDPAIALSFKNFKYLCQTCHNKQVDPSRRAAGRVDYGPDGEIIKRE